MVSSFSPRRGTKMSANPGAVTFNVAALSGMLSENLPSSPVMAMARASTTATRAPGKGSPVEESRTTPVSVAPATVCCAVDSALCACAATGMLSPMSAATDAYTTGRSILFVLLYECFMMVVYFLIGTNNTRSMRNLRTISLRLNSALVTSVLISSLVVLTRSADVCNGSMSHSMS